MASEYGYRFTEHAEADLDDIVDHIAVELGNPVAASDFLDALDAAIGEARSYPEGGPRVVNEFLPTSTVRKKFIKNYIMYYIPDHAAKLIFILRIVYGRRDLNEIEKEFNAADGG